MGSDTHESHKTMPRVITTPRQLPKQPLDLVCLQPTSYLESIGYYARHSLGSLIGIATQSTTHFEHAISEILDYEGPIPMICR